MRRNVIPHKKVQGKETWHGEGWGEGNRCRKAGTRKRGWFVRIITGFFKLLIILAVTFLLAVGGMNLSMILGTSDRILTQEEAKTISDADYILILGASVRGKEPSAMLRDRLDTGIALYQSGVSDRLLMSGDGSSKYYNEVNTMKLYSMEAGVPGEQIELDPQGLCTYDSIRNAIDEYDAEKIIIVTQKYHMYRALYIADQLGLEAWGVNSDPRTYSEQGARELREIAARCKDFLMVWLGKYSDPAFEKLTKNIAKLAVRY